MKDLFNKFYNEIESIPDITCHTPYDYSQYTDKKTIKILKDIDDNHNHSWIKEIWLRNNNKLNYIAINYRNQKFTYRDFFNESYRYASALKANDFLKGQELVCAIENTPEFPFIMAAASMLGAKVNLVSAEFDFDYLKEIVNNATSPFIFVSDMSFTKFLPVLKEVEEYKKIILLPIEYTLKNGNPYKDITEKYYKLDESDYNNSLKSLSNVINIDDFLRSGNEYNKKVVEQVDLNDEFTITYTSGSTGWGKPKGLVHKVRSYVTMGRFHDYEVSGIPTLEKRTVLTLVKTMSDTDFMSNISDTFMQSGTVALEPINDKEYVLTSLIINKPTLALASRSHWLYAMKQQKLDKSFSNIKLPFLFVPMSIGEPLEVNEEKALNKWLRSLKAGIEVTKTPFSVISMSTAGGDSEHGGIFLSLYRSLQSKNLSHIGINEPIGMKTFGMVQIKALREDKTYCNPMELGQLVANSPCTMKGYTNNLQANEDFFIKDAYGITWGNLNTYGYIDKTNHIYIKGRINKTDINIQNYLVTATILKDTKKILSCEVVNFKENNKTIYVAHIEPQMDTSFNENKVMKGATIRCLNKFGYEFINNLYFRIKSNQESFELLHTGKRNSIILLQEGLSDKCIKASSLIEKQEPKIKKYIKS